MERQEWWRGEVVGRVGVAHSYRTCWALGTAQMWQCLDGVWKIIWLRCINNGGRCHGGHGPMTGYGWMWTAPPAACLPASMTVCGAIMIWDIIPEVPQHSQENNRSRTREGWMGRGVSEGQGHPCLLLDFMWDDESPWQICAKGDTELVAEMFTDTQTFNTYVFVVKNKQEKLLVYIWLLVSCCWLILSHWQYCYQ